MLILAEKNHSQEIDAIEPDAGAGIPGPDLNTKHLPTKKTVAK
jgi:hypothetical protein